MKTWRLLFLTFLLYAIFAGFFLYKGWQLQQALTAFKLQRRQTLAAQAARADSLQQLRAEENLGEITFK